LKLMTIGYDPHRPALSFEKIRKQYGDIFLIDLFGKRMVCVSNAEQYEHIFRNTGKFPNGTDVAPWLFRETLKMKNDDKYEPIIISLKGDRWKQNRQLIDDFFLNDKTTETFLPKMNEICIDLAGVLKKNLSGGKSRQVRELERNFYRFSTVVIGNFIFGKRINVLSPGSVSHNGEQFLNALFSTFNEASNLLYSVPLYRYINTPGWKRFNRNVDLLYSTGNQFLHDADQYYMNTGALRSDFVNHLRTQGQNEARVLADTIVMFFAGADSTANSLLWLVQNLGTLTAVQDHCRNEIEKIFPEDALPTRELLSKLKYVRAVIKESARLNPVTLANIRIFSDPIEISGYEIPSQTRLLLLHSLTNKDDSVFTDASRFNPDRWLDRSQKAAPFSFEPFGFGPRKCPGFRIADSEIMLAICGLLRNFRWRTLETYG